MSTTAIVAMSLGLAAAVGGAVWYLSRQNAPGTVAPAAPPERVPTPPPPPPAPVQAPPANAPTNQDANQASMANLAALLASLRQGPVVGAGGVIPVPTVDPVALAVLQNSGQLIKGLGGLAKDLPGIITGFQDLASDHPDDLVFDTGSYAQNFTW